MANEETEAAIKKRRDNLLLQFIELNVQVLYRDTDLASSTSQTIISFLVVSSNRNCR